MSVAVSLPGLVSQRQCKVTARRTRASRYRHVCKELRQPLPMRFLVIASFPCALFYAVFQYISVSSPYHAHRPCGNVPPLHLFFCAAPPTPSIAAYPSFNANRPILFCLSRSCVLKKSAWVLQIFREENRRHECDNV